MRSFHLSALILPVVLLSSACEEPADPVVTPEMPTVMVAPVSCSETISVTGIKQSSTAVFINGMEIVPLDEANTYNASIKLDGEGEKTIRVHVQSATGEKSPTVSANTVVDLSKPATPTVNDIPLVVTDTEYTVTGTKEAGTSVIINGTERVPADSATTWMYTVSLQRGSNPLVIAAKDACRESDSVMKDIFQDPSGVGLTVNPVMTPTCDATQRICGERADGVEILLDNNVIDVGMAMAWCYTVQLQPGLNRFTFVGRVGMNISLPREVSIEHDNTPPAPPMLTTPAPRYTSDGMLMIAGNKEANTEILVNDQTKVPQDAMTVFMFTQTLTEGDNQLQIDTKDFCGRTSGNPAIVRVTLDTMAPTIMLTRPTTGDTLTGVATVEGRAMDNTQLDHVQILIDGTEVTRIPLTRSSTFSGTFDTTRHTDGPHLLQGKAVDRAGRESTPVGIMIEISNSARLVSDDNGMPPPNNDEAQARSASPAIKVLSDGAVAIAWHDNLDIAESGNDDDILLRVFANGTMALPIANVSAHMNDAVSRSPRLAAGTQGSLHIVWTENGDIDGDRRVDDDIIYRGYANGQLSAQYVVISTNNRGEDGRSSSPDIASSSSGELHVVWQDDGDLDADGDTDRDIYYARGSAAGVFSQPVLISDHPMDGESVVPRIAVTPDGCPHIVWQDSGAIAQQDTDGGDPDIYYRGSTPNMMGGCTFGPIVLISEENGFMRLTRPAIATDPMDPRGLIWIAWDGEGNVQNNGTDRDVFLRNVSNNIGGALVVISDDQNDGLSHSGALTVDSNTDVHIAWVDLGNIAGTGTDADIFIRSWNGLMFTPISSVSDIGMNMVNREESLSPDLSTRGTRLYITWQDRSDYDRDGIADGDIMYLIRN